MVCVTLDRDLFKVHLNLILNPQATRSIPNVINSLNWIFFSLKEAISLIANLSDVELFYCWQSKEYVSRDFILIVAVEFCVN